MTAKQAEEQSALERQRGLERAKKEGRKTGAVRLHKDMEHLTASPRDATHPTGYLEQARFVAARLQEQGVLPAGDGKSGLKRYLQPFKWKQFFAKGYAQSDNVVGIQRGDGSTNEAILVIAHLDGLSAAEKAWYEKKAPKDERVKNEGHYEGANDNASAVAASLHISDEIGKLVRQSGPLKRDIVFLYPSAEEDGLKGTEAFAKLSKQFGGKKFVGVVNMEMVGKGDPNHIRVFGGRSEVSERANPVFKKALRLKVQGDMAHVVDGHPRDGGEGWWDRSDHFVTARAGIPSVLYVGDNGHDYHTPKDDLGSIKFKTEKAVADHALGLVMALANDPKPGEKGRSLPVPRNLDTDNPGRILPVH
jgi:hypothetical protein